MKSRSKVHRWGVILAGGKGTRLLPLTSRRLTGDDRPKQFYEIIGNETLLNQTRSRVASPSDRMVPHGCGLGWSNPVEPSRARARQRHNRAANAISFPDREPTVDILLAYLMGNTLLVAGAGSPHEEMTEGSN